VLIVIVAVAGRRIDAADAAVARFPLANRGLVARRIGAALGRLDATAVIASAACGADLLALEAAQRQGMRRRVILPYAEEWFLEDSVLDRPGRWAGAFRAQYAAARGDAGAECRRYRNRQCSSSRHAGKRRGQALA
jgi:hypothetical protein